MQFRRVGVFALVAIGLVGCGTAVSHALGAQPAVVSNACTAVQPTAAEAALGQGSICDPTLTTAQLTSIGLSITAPASSQAAPAISQTQAEQIAAVNTPGNFDKPVGTVGTQNVKSSLLCLAHDAQGSPASGELVWLVDFTGSFPGPAYGGPPAASTPDSTVTAEVVEIDANTGAVVQDVTVQGG